MSIYSEAPARIIDKKYNKTVYNLVFLLQTYIHRSINNSILVKNLVSINETSFVKHFSKLYKRLHAYEECRGVPLQYSYAAKDLAVDYGVFAKSGAFTASSASFTSATDPSNFSLRNQS
eukprot:TRINITY_DN2058_c0_g6_i1.p2 TRINITY_DN2058_c0_g6~~TRINITY_DN2058_c0_g6_i1.p2  ORF type:complete len:119 (+),score=20.80 TRINITY_DN2058_c0_g6_i1:152-508(+)